MAKITPNIEEFGCTVSVPVSKPIAIFKSDINGCENYFWNLMNNERNFNRQKEYDLCATLIKWASTCNAGIQNIKNDSDIAGIKHKMYFTFGFYSLEDLYLFQKDLKTNVSI